MVIEVNLSPGLQGITKATGINVADKIARYLYERTKSITEAGTKKGAVEIMKEINGKEDFGWKPKERSLSHSEILNQLERYRSVT